MKKWLLFPLIVFLLTVSSGNSVNITHAQTGGVCPDIGTILDLPTSAGEMVRGGDILTPGQVVSAEITADDAGDRWLIPAVSGAGQMTIHVTGNDIPLIVTLLRGFEEIRTGAVQVGGTSIVVTIPAHGYYTLVIHRESVIDTEVTGSYSLSVEGAIARVLDGSEVKEAAKYITYLRPVGGPDGTIRIHYEGNSAATINVSNNSGEILNQRVEGLADVEIEASGYYAFRVNTTGAHSISLSTVDITGQGNISIQPFFQPNLTNTQIEAPTIEDGLLTIFPGDDITIQTYVDAVRDIAVGSAIRLVFANPSLEVNGGSLSFARNELERVTILENGVTVTRTNDRQLYIGSFDVRSQLANDNGFQNFALPDGRSVTQASWNVLDRVVLLEDCVGADFETGMIFIGEGEDYSLGGTGTESGNQIVTAESEDVRYRANVEMNRVARLEAGNGRLNIDLVDGHALSIDRPDINLTTTESGLLRVNDNVNDARLVLTDWERLDSITVDGLQTTLETTDLRGTVTRSGSELREFEARDGVFDMVWADGSSTLLLNESNDFIQIESPAAPPEYDPQARPGETGYIPSNMNNVGQECSPVNTAFQFNCTANGLGNPVNGNLSMTVTDLFARGYRLDLQLTRTYNSANADINGPFGLGWDSNILPEILAPFDAEESARIPAADFESALDLSLAPLGQITLRTASGSRHVFGQGSTRWTSLNLPGWSAEIRADDLLSPWRILSSEGVVYEYDIAGRLRGIRHADGGRIEIEREGQWFNRPQDDAPVYMVRDDTGRAIRLEFNDNAHVVRAELVVDGEVWDWATFTYDEDFLVGVTHQDGAESAYEYDANNRLIHHADEHAPLAPELYYAYNSTGKICNIALARPNCEAGEASYRTYRYDEGSTRVRDEWGHVQTWNYVLGETPDSSYQVTAIEPDGMTDIEYASNNVVDSFSRNGVVHNLLNYAGNFTQLTSAEWIGFVAEYIDMTVDIDGDGSLDDYTIKRLLSYDTDPGSSFIPPITYEYNDIGRLIEVNHEGVTSVIEYDNRWSLPSTVITSQDDEPGQTIQFTYDDNGFVQQRVDANGTHNFMWNPLGQLLEYSLVSGSEEVLKYTFSYEDDCTLIEDHLASHYMFCYNHVGQIIEETVEAGDYFSETNYAYDSLGRISTIERYVDEDTVYLTTYEYDGVRGAGNWNVRITNPDGVQHVTQYDWQGNVVGKIDPAGRATVYEYGERAENGSVTTTAVFPNGNERQYLYNRTGQLCSLTQGETVWQFVYDTPNCLRSSSRLPSQLILSEEVTIRFEEYDSAGRPTRIEYFVRRPSADDPDARELSNGNDPGIVFEYDYDALGRLVSIVNEETGASRTIDYMQADGVTEIIEQVGEVITRYQFDPLGRLIVKENDAGSATYEYTAERQTVRVEATFTTDDSANNWQLVYNGVGQVVEWVDEDNIPTRYAYDGLGRLMTIERNDEVIAAYQYDASNHVTIITDESTRQASYVYDNFGQLTTVVDFDGTFETFIYNPFGNLRTSIDSLGFTTIYDYDELNRVTGITDPIGYRAEFDWRDDGRLIYDDSRLETTFYHDPLGRLWQIRGLQGDEGNVHRLDYDSNSYLEAFSPWDDRFAYDFEENDQGQVTAITGPDEWVLGFVYDDLGRLVGRSSALETIELDYDRIGRLTTLGDKIYTYTPGSIEISPDGEVLTYDSLDRLLSDTGRTITYSDDGQTTTINYDDGFYDIIAFADAVTDVQAFMTLEHYTPDDVLFRERQYILNARGDLIMQRVIDYFEDEQRYVQEFVYSYDAVGRPIRFVDANNNLYFYSYDTKGDLISVQFPDGNVYQYGYDALRNLISITNPAGQIVRLANTSAGEVEQISLNGQPLERYEYSDLGWLIERSFVDFTQSDATTGSGELMFSYDAMGVPTGWQIDDASLGQITTRCVADLTQGVAWRYIFDDDGRVTRVTTVEGGCQGEVIQRLPVAYDSRDRLVTNSILEHSYSYEDGTYTLTTTYESGETIIITFDDYLHVESIDVEGEVIDVEYSSAQLDLNTLEVQLTWGDRYISNVRFNRNDQTTRIEYLDSRDPTFFLPVRYTVTYDGLPLSVIEPLRNNIVVGYDSARRPLSTVWLFAGRASQGQTGTVDYSFTLTYDNLGNRIRESLQFPNGEQFEFEYVYDEGDLLVERRLATDDMTSADSSTASTQGYLGIAGIIMVIVAAVAFRRRLTLRYVVSGVVLVVIISSVAFAQTGTRYQYTYNGRGHVSTVTNGTTEQLTFDYDAFGRIVSIVNSNGEESTFTYNGFYQLASYTTTAGTFEYVYDAGRPVGVRMDGELKIFAGIFNDQPLLMKSADESQWLLYDGQGTLRQTFIDEHNSGENTVNSGTDILGRSVHPADSLASLPAGIPVFNGMLFDEPSNMLVTLDGRVYDPLVGRYLQRDVLGPDASGNIYGYAPLRDEPPVANRVTYPFAEAFQLLLDLNQRLATPMAEDVFEEWLPTPDRFWLDSRLAILNDFNVGISGFAGRHLELPRFVGYTYNPPGVVVGSDGNFDLFDLTSSQRVDVQPLLPGNFDTVGSSSLLPDLAGLYGLASTTEFVQDWYDADGWQERTQAAYRGLPSVDSIDPYLDTYFQNALLYGELFTVLEDMPDENASTWQAMVETENMPDLPEIFPADPRAWLEQWLTTDTIPTWTQLRNIYAQLPVPGSAARDVRLPVEGN